MLQTEHRKGTVESKQAVVTAARASQCQQLVHPSAFNAQALRLMGHITQCLRVTLSLPQARTMCCPQVALVVPAVHEGPLRYARLLAVAAAAAAALPLLLLPQLLRPS